MKFVKISFSTSTFDRITKVSQISIKNYESYNSVGPSSQICGPAVCYRRHHGASHRLLSHQRRGDCLLPGQDYLEHHEREILKKTFFEFDLLLEDLNVLFLYLDVEIKNYNATSGN